MGIFYEKKKILKLLIIFALSMLFMLLKNNCYAATIDELKSKYPDGSCWNDGGVTWSPCTDHGVGDLGSRCNCYDGGYQCVGFARLLFHEINNKLK